jgi:hypothetical protein
MGGCAAKKKNIKNYLSRSGWLERRQAGCKKQNYQNYQDWLGFCDIMVIQSICYIEK